jgi:hypothetical protein
VVEGRKVVDNLGTQLIKDAFGDYFTAVGGRNDGNAKTIFEPLDHLNRQL